MKTKTIDIEAKEWFDRVNGNSYFSAIATVNFGTKNEKNIKVRFQYGYENHYIDIAADELQKAGYIDREQYENGSKTPLWRYCRENKIILRTIKQENCLQKDCKAFVR